MWLSFLRRQFYRNSSPLLPRDYREVSSDLIITQQGLVRRQGTKIVTGMSFAANQVDGDDDQMADGY